MKANYEEFVEIKNVKEYVDNIVKDMKKENVSIMQNYSFSDNGNGQIYYNLDGLYEKNLTKKEIGYTTSSSVTATPTYTTVSSNSGSVSTSMAGNTIYVWVRLTYSDLGEVIINSNKYGNRYSVYLDSGGIQACFDGDTEVLTTRGLCKIKDLKLNDEVITENGAQPISKIYAHFVDKLYRMHVGNEEIKCSFSHPFITERGKVCAKDLIVGDKMWTIDNEMLEVTKIEIDETSTPVFEINTENAEKYYVTNSKILVGSEELGI